MLKTGPEGREGTTQNELERSHLQTCSVEVCVGDLKDLDSIAAGGRGPKSEAISHSFPVDLIGVEPCRAML